MSSNKNLHSAKKAKNDEFYTRLEDIEKEVKHYRKHFKNKTVYCNCDDDKSNFYTFFYLQFNSLKLKKLIATHFSKTAPAFKIEVIRHKDYNEEAYKNNSSILSIKHDTSNNLDVMIIKEKLKTNGDFRSPECIELLKEADIVVTNPPFSLFREYVKQLFTYNKKFLIIGSINAITYKEIFALIKENKLWLGYNFNKNLEFRVPATYKLVKGKYRQDNTGNYYVKVPGIAWYTNLEIDKRNEELILYRTYNPKDYPKYDNYDVIEVSRVTDIPKDYDGVMGVPISFLGKYNPNQFEIVGWSRHNDLNMDGGYWLGGNNDATVNGRSVYMRVFIKRKKDSKGGTA